MAFNPTTLDTSSGVLFKFQFDKIPHVDFFSYSVNIPGITGGEVIQPTPIYDIKLPGDKLVFEPLIVNFLVTENLQNYKEIYDWLLGIYYPNTTDQYTELITKDRNKTKMQNKYGDAHMFVLTNKMNPIARIKFIEAYPIALSPLTYDSTVTDTVPLTCDATFNYTYYTMEIL